MLADRFLEDLISRTGELCPLSCEKRAKVGLSSNKFMLIY